MPRLPRVYIKESSYYITCKGLPGQKIFMDNRDFEMYFSLLKKYKDEHGVKVYSYGLMPDHLHLLVEVDDKTPISSFMHNLTSAYTKYYNSRYERKGHLFRERFKAAMVENDPALLLNLTAYIHLNPQRLKIALQAETYPHTSYGLYLDYDQHDDHGLALKNEITSLLNSLLGEQYTQVVERLQKSEEYHKLHKKLHRNRMVGSDEFINRIKNEIDLQRRQSDQPATAQVGDDQPAATGSRRMGALLLVAVAAAGVYLYVSLRQPRSALDQKTGGSAMVSPMLKDLENTEWQIRLVGADKAERGDIISFQNKKFVSGYLAQFQFPQTNYSLAREDNRIVWETMQTSAQATASWRGEVDSQGNMRGIMSLRQNGSGPQDFSFISLNYRRK